MGVDSIIWRCMVLLLLLPHPAHRYVTSCHAVFVGVEEGHKDEGRCYPHRHGQEVLRPSMAHVPLLTCMCKYDCAVTSDVEEGHTKMRADGTLRRCSTLLLLLSHPAHRYVPHYHAVFIGVEEGYQDEGGRYTHGHGRGVKEHDPAVAAGPLQHAHGCFHSACQHVYGGPPEEAVCQHEQEEKDEGY